MVEKQTQKHRVTITFEIEAEIFPGDPDDVYDLAYLEAESIRRQSYSLTNLHESIDPLDIDVEVEPIL